MRTAAVPFQRIVFVCLNRRDNGEACCADREAEKIWERLKARVKELGLSGKVRVSKSGCHDVCAQGPSVMLFPENRWYSQVTAEDVEQILADATQGLR